VFFKQKFFYNKYLAKSKIFATCYRPQIKVIGKSHHWRNLLFKSHQYFWLNLNNYLPEPASSLAKATILANTREMSQGLRDIFSQTGLSHAVAISGSHITILSAMIINFLLALGFSRRRSLLIVFGFFFVYPLIQKTDMIIRTVINTMLNGKYPDNSAAVMP